MNTNRKKKPGESEDDEKFPLPVYEPGDDIYSRGKELSFEEIENPDAITMGNEGRILGSELDTPGTELDDNDEGIGEEDEENNYYSLGGDDHEDLEEENTEVI
ncbi:MAG: hypothetical protein ABUT20_46720 [Bacteroidota bacterium]